MAAKSLVGHAALWSCVCSGCQLNNLVNDEGKRFKCLQRAITVSSAKDVGEASEKAQREFERLEDVPNWKCHAQFLEVESTDIVRK